MPLFRHHEELILPPIIQKQPPEEQFGDDYFSFVPRIQRQFKVERLTPQELVRLPEAVHAFFTGYYTYLYQEGVLRDSRAVESRTALVTHTLSERLFSPDYLEPTLQVINPALHQAVTDAFPWVESIVWLGSNASGANEVRRAIGYHTNTQEDLDVGVILRQGASVETAQLEELGRFVVEHLSLITGTQELICVQS